MAFSKEIDSLPITTIKLDAKPCMDPGYSPTADSHHVCEVNKYHGCPLEANSNEYFDQSYKGGDTLPFQRSEWEIQKHPMNRVADLLYTSSGYSYSAGDYEGAKRGFNYYFWTRPTIPWDLSCEFQGKSRE